VIEIAYITKTDSLKNKIDKPLTNHGKYEISVAVIRNERGTLTRTLKKTRGNIKRLL
jgi:hypothetical protein